MQLGLSSDAAPGASIAELRASCVRRGLATLELRVGIEGVSAPALYDLLPLAAEQPRLAGLLTDDAGCSPALVRLACATGVPVVLAGAAEGAARVAKARRTAPRACTVLPLLHGPAAGWIDAVAQSDVAFAWQIDDRCTDLEGDTRRVLQHAQLLRYIRLVGGGPEAAMQEGRGIGALTRQLTLTGYDGPLILAPSSPRFRVAWATWLGRRGGWGCGSRAQRAAPLKITTES